MKKLSKRFIISVLTLVLTVVALGTSTFAWFSLSTVSSVSNIGGDVTAGDGLQIKLSGTKPGGSLKETQWMSNIDFSSFIALIAPDLEFDAVTTLDGKTGFTKMGSTNNGNLHLNAATTANKDYIEFTIHFKSQKAGTVDLTNLVFGGSNTATFQSTGADYVQVPTKAASNVPVTTAAANGARISFTGSSTTVYQKANSDLTLNLDGDSEPESVTGNYVMESEAIVGGQWSYLTQGLGLRIFNNAAENTEYLDGDLPTNLLVAATDITETGTSTSIELVQTGGTGNFLGEVVVRVWLEGWDVDTYDSIFTLNLRIDLTFKKRPPVVTP